MSPGHEIIFIDELAQMLRTSISTIRKRLREGVFPVAPLPRIDAQYRWSRTQVQRWLDSPSSRLSVRRRSA